MPKPKTLLRAVLALGCAAAGALAMAQAKFPDKPVRLTVPYAPGGAGDVMAHALAQQLEAGWKQPVVVDYRPGASTIVALQAIANAPKDGYNLVLCGPPLATNEVLYQKLPYKFDDIAGVSVIVRNPYVMVISRTLPVEKAGDLVALAKKEPGKYNFASLGPGSPTNFLARAFARQTGTDLVEIPFKGSGQVLPELVTGRVHIYFDSLGGALPGHRQGMDKILGIAAPERSAAAPDIPTLAEQGIPFNYDSWFGVCAPAGVPAPVMNALGDAVRKAVATPEYQSTIRKLGGNPVASASPEEFQHFIRNDIDVWGRIIKPLNIKLD